MKLFTLRRLLALTLLAVTTRVMAADTKYNVLFIAVDDMRPELGCYGNTIVKTPKMDDLAKSGLQFNRAYCQFALCNPSRSSLLTGRRPETTKIFNLETFFRTYSSNVVTLPQLFKNNGYDTRNFGKIFHNGNGNHDDNLSWSVKPWHSINDDQPAKKAVKKEAKKAKAEGDPDEDPHNQDMPYGDPAVADDGLQDGQTTLHGLAAMREMKDKPFFLAIGFHRPHLPFVAPKKYWDFYDPKQIALAPNPFHPTNSPAFASNGASEIHRYKGVPPGNPLPDELSRKLIHGYYASISYVDAQVGKILAELDKLGLREKTIIVLWGDHGYQLGEHNTWNKRTDWEICDRVPLFVSVPKQKTAGQKTGALVEFVDLYPTLAELCGLTPPAGLEGASFVRLLDNEKQRWKTAAFTTYVKRVPEMGGQTFGRAMRTDRYRFVEWNCEKSGKTEYELYDDEKDPQENISIANLPENKELVAQLTKQLHAGWKAALPPK